VHKARGLRNLAKMIVGLAHCAGGGRRRSRAATLARPFSSTGGNAVHNGRHELRRLALGIHRWLTRLAFKAVDKRFRPNSERRILALGSVRRPRLPANLL